jgi:hypothetical protein
MECRNEKRFTKILQPGDQIRAFVNHRGIGFYTNLEVRAVAHWGVNAILRGDEAEKQSKNFVWEFYDQLVKRQFLVKWCHVQGFVLL